jgi:RHS repeat-associated protein
MIASDTPILQQNSGTWYYHINDPLGTCRVVTDHQGQVIRAQDYFPFGLTLRSLNNKKTRFSYTGKELDTAGALGWFYFGARFFDPEIGRFLSIDPLADKFLGWSPYVYSLNNPTKYTDPDGKSPYGVYNPKAIINTASNWGILSTIKTCFQHPKDAVGMTAAGQAKIGETASDYLGKAAIVSIMELKISESLAAASTIAIGYSFAMNLIASKFGYGSKTQTNRALLKLTGGIIAPKLGYKLANILTDKRNKTFNVLSIKRNKIENMSTQSFNYLWNKTITSNLSQKNDKKSDDSEKKDIFQDNDDK